MKLLNFFLLTLLSTSSIAGVLIDVPTALKQNFGDYEIRKEKVFLTGPVIKELERVSKAKFESKIYSVYVPGKPVALVYSLKLFKV